MPTFAVTTVYNRAHDAARLAARPAHREWLAGLKESGQLVNAGPFAHDKGALLLFVAADADALSTLLDADPYPKGSVEYNVLGEWKHLFPFA